MERLARDHGRGSNLPGVWPVGMTTVPAILTDRAQLPKRYTEACAALHRCDQVDECAEWANRAAAIASYARQARDETLKNHAARIQARAVRRMGELLNQIPAVPPTQTRKAIGLVTRSTVAGNAGITEHQKNQAIQVGKVRDAEFEKLVESDHPPGISALARLGAKPRRFVRKSEANAKRVRRFAAWCAGAERLREVDLDDVRAIFAWCAALLERK
jgi:hypothetical protein